MTAAQSSSLRTKLREAREGIVEIYRPLFDPNIGAEEMGYLLGVCRRETDQALDAICQLFTEELEAVAAEQERILRSKLNG